MNNPENYCYKLVCVDENNIYEYEVLEDVNAGSLDGIYKELVARITHHNIGQTKWILLPMLKPKVGSA